MKLKSIFVLLLLTVIAVVGVQQTFALQAYMDAYNSTFNTNASCDVCHVNPAGGGARNSYGTLFASQPDHAANPDAALAAIGRAPTATATATSTVTPTLTPAATSVTPTPEPTETYETPEPTETYETPTPEPTETYETPTPTATPKTPGFEQVFFIIGLLAGYVLLKKHNK